MSRELGASIKIPPWGLNYISPSFFCFVSPLGIFTLHVLKLVDGIRI